MEILRVDGVALPTPSEMEYKEADLQWDGYRDAAGVIHKTTVRWGVRSIKVKWSRHLSNEELNTIRTATAQKEFMTVNYFSDTLGEAGTMTAYTGDFDFKLVRATSAIDAKWSDVSIDFIEQ